MIQTATQNKLCFKAKNDADVFFNVGRLPRAVGEGDQIVIAVGSFYSQKLQLVWTDNALVS